MACSHGDMAWGVIDGWGGRTLRQELGRSLYGTEE